MEEGNKFKEITIKVRECRKSREKEEESTWSVKDVCVGTCNVWKGYL